MSPRILIVGAGAIGQWMAALLQDRTRARVQLLVRARQLSRLQAGIVLVDRCLPVECLTEIPPEQSYDDIIFTVKAFQVGEAAQQVGSYGTRAQRVWGFQNGLGSDEFLRAAFPEAWFGALTSTVPVAIEDEGRILPGNKGGLAWASPHDPHLAPEWLRHLGYPCYAAARVDSLKVSKLLLNLTCNASCALLDQLPGEIVAHTKMFTFELACLRELLRVSKALGIPLVDLPGYAVTKMAAVSPLPDLLVRQILGSKIKKARGRKPPSLLVDLRAGRPQSEVDVLNGAVVALGQQCGLATPGNAWLHQTLASVVSGQRPWSDFRGKIDGMAEQALESLKRKGAP